MNEVEGGEADTPIAPGNPLAPIAAEPLTNRSGEEASEVTDNTSASHSTATMSSVAEAFQRLVNAVLEKRALPFVGAGVSASADYRARNGSDPKPTTRELQTRLVNWLRNRAAACEATRRAVEGALGALDDARPENLPLPWLAEQFVQLNSEEHLALCQHLEVERFAGLLPTPAHRYLAFLAREGLISEVITTNYDRCLETAFDESKSGSLPPREEPGRRPGCHAVTDAPTSSSRLVGGQPLLTVYKVNGCAASYRAGDAQSARRIVLTELDLQAWHGESWARRLFNQRCDQHCVVLTGFSGEEAQVRFAVAALCHELRVASGKVSPLEVAALPNAPFVQERKATLNRFQQQILYVWFEGCTEEASRRDLPAADRIAFAQANAFTGMHGDFFRDDSDSLTADRFWEAVFMATWRKLLAGEMTTGTTSRFLRSRRIDSSGWEERLLEALFGPDEGQCPHSSLLALRTGDQRDGPAIPLVRWVEALLPHLRTTGTAGRYVALRDQPLTIGLLLLFLAWSRLGAEDVACDPAVASLGARLRCRPAFEMETWLAGQYSLPGQSEFPDSRESDLAFVQIVLPSFEGEDSPSEEAVRWVREIRHDANNTETRCHGIRIKAGLLFREVASRLQAGSRPESPQSSCEWSELCDALDAAVTQAVKLYQEHPSSYRDRTFDFEGVR